LEKGKTRETILGGLNFNIFKYTNN